MLKSLELSLPRWLTNQHYVYVYLQHSLHMFSLFCLS